MGAIGESQRGRAAEVVGESQREKSCGDETRSDGIIGRQSHQEVGEQSLWWISLRSKSSPRRGYAFHNDYYDGRGRSLTRRLELLLFGGENAESWVLKVEQYFKVSDYSEEEKLRHVRTCFDGEALLYRWERDRNPFQSWSQMKIRVFEQYSMNRDTSTGERLLTLRQTGTVREYCRDFKNLAMNAPELTEEVL